VVGGIYNYGIGVFTSGNYVCQGNPSTTNVISYVILGCCLTVAFWLYPAYFEKHQEDIAKNYEDEIAEWEKEHPDHEFSQEDYKYEVNA